MKQWAETNYRWLMLWLMIAQCGIGLIAIGVELVVIWILLRMLYAG